MLFGFGNKGKEQMSIIWEYSKPVEIFISYASEDEPLLDALEKYLRILKRQGYILSWHMFSITEK